MSRGFVNKKVLHYVMDIFTLLYFILYFNGLPIQRTCSIVQENPKKETISLTEGLPMTHNNSVNRSILYGLREALFFK